MYSHNVAKFLKKIFPNAYLKIRNLEE